MARTPKGYVTRRGDEINHPPWPEDWPHGDDCADRWYTDKIGEQIDHRGPGYRTRAEAIETLRERLSARDRWSSDPRRNY